MHSLLALWVTKETMPMPVQRPREHREVAEERTCVALKCLPIDTPPHLPLATSSSSGERCLKIFQRGCTTSLRSSHWPRVWKHLTPPPMVPSHGEWRWVFFLFRIRRRRRRRNNFHFLFNKEEPSLVLLNRSELCVHLFGCLRLPLVRSKGWIPLA